MKRLILAAFLLSAVSVSFANGNAKSLVTYMKSGGDDGGGKHISPSQVPDAVMTTFNNKFPNANNVQWEVEKEHGSKVYQAEFSQNGKRFKAQFAPDGTFLGKKRA